MEKIGILPHHDLKLPSTKKIIIKKIMKQKTNWENVCQKHETK